MANSIDYAELFQQGLDEQMIQSSVTGAMELNASQVRYNGGNTIRIPKISMDGLKDYSRADGFGSAGAVTLEFETHTFDKDRAQSFSLDAMDVDESNFVATGSNVMGQFQRTKVVPEVDAYRLSKIYDYANGAGNYGVYSPVKATIFEQLKADVATVQNVVGEGEALTIYMSIPTAVTLDLADKISHELSVIDFMKGDVATEVKSLDGIPIIKVPSLRFKNSYTFGSNGFSADTGALDMNWIIVANRSVIAISKTDKMRIFDPTVNQSADAWKMDYRKYHTLIMPDNKIDGLFVSYSAEAISSSAFTLVTGNNTTTITLTAGAFKSGVSMDDLSFAGTDATALAGSTLVRTSDTVVTLTHATGNTGTDNVVTVEATGVELQATAVTAVGSTV